MKTFKFKVWPENRYTKLMTLGCVLSFALQTQGKDGCRDLHYLECIGNKTLTGHVIDSSRMITPVKANCQNKCYHDNRCVSYNLGPVGGVTRQCELNAADHSSRPSFFVDKTGHEYCPIKNPCLAKPCLPGRLCTPDFDWDTFNCDGGGWTQWGPWQWADCSLPSTCVPKRTRTCTSPAPQNNGASCDGPSDDTKQCEPLPDVNTAGCEKALGMEDGRITDQQITESSYAGNHKIYLGRNGRLNKTPGWAAGSKQVGEHIQIDLGSKKVVTMVATRGRRDCCNQWVTKYSLSYSDDGNNWKNYQGDCTKIFPGNADNSTIVTNKLEVPIKARYIRLIVKEYHGWATVTMELYGCSQLAV